MVRMRWLVFSTVITALLAGAMLSAGCAGLGKSSQRVFTPTQGAPVQSEPSTTVPGYWAGVVPWEPTDGVVEVTTAPQAELYPGDGKFTQSVADIPFVSPPQDARSTSSMLEGDGYYYAEHVSPSEVQGLTFDPAGGPAFACYELALAADAPMTIGIAWYSMPTNFDSYYIGIGDTQANVWHWYMGPDDGVLTFDPSDWDGEVASSVLVCVALQDGLLADFWKLKAGVSEVRGTGLEYEEVPADKVLSSVDVSIKGLPASVDLTEHIHGVRNQGSMGSCTAFACTDASLSILLNQVYGSTGWNTADDPLKPSPMWAYVRSGIPPIGNWNPVCGSSVGRYMSQAFGVLENVGVAMESTVPYYATSNCSTTFPAAADTEASLVQLSDWYSLSGPDLAEATKLQLATYNRPVVIAMYKLEYTFMNYSSGVYKFNPTGAYVNGGHAMCIVGYDDSLQAFKVRNSWGTTWGQGGYWWCSYDSVDQMAAAGRLSAYVEELEYNPAAASHFLGTAPITIDEVEPNNEPKQANALPAFPVDGYAGGLGDNDGADCFTFDYRAEYATDFSVIITGSLLLRLELCTTSGQLIYRPGEGESPTSISGQWLNDGTAVLRVQWLSGKGYYSLTAGERCPPAIPDGLSASDGSHTDAVMLSWNASPGATSYSVERASSADGPFTEIGTTFTPSYTDTGAELWSYYYYRVRAGSGNGASMPSAVDRGYRQVPAPAYVRAGDGDMDDRVRVSWQGIPGGGVEYTVSRSMFREGPYIEIGTTTALFFDDSNVESGVPHYYTVSAGKEDFVGPASVPDSGYCHQFDDTSSGRDSVVIPSQPDLPGNSGLSDDGRVTVGDESGGQPQPVRPDK